MEKWIGYEEEGFLIPRGRGTLDRIEGSELRDTETPTQNNAIRVLAYTGHKSIVDPDPIKVQPNWHICTHENTWLRKVSWDLCNGHGVTLTGGQEANPSLSSNSQLDWVATFYLLKPPKSRLQ